MHRLLPVLVVSAWASIPTAVNARTESLAVLPIVVGGPEGRALETKIHETVVRAAQRRLDLHVLSAEEIFVASREGLNERVADCGTDLGCIANRLRIFDARFALVVVLSFELAPPIYRLQLVDTNLGKGIQERLFETGQEPLADLARLTDEVLDGAGMNKRGRIVVETAPIDAQLFLQNGNTPDPDTKNVFTLIPGHYTMEGRAEGYDPGTLEFEINAGETKTLPLTLSKEPSLWSSPWIWVAIGAAVVGGTATAIVVSQPSERCLCTSLAGQPCGCR